MPADLVERLRAALDEHERIARHAATVRGGAAEWQVGEIRDEINNATDHTLEIGERLLIGALRPDDEDDPLLTAELAHMAANDPAHALRTVQAHREVLDRHSRTWHFDQIWMCRKCGNAQAPCADVRSLVSIYFPGHSAVGGAEGHPEKIIEEGDHAV